MARTIKTDNVVSLEIKDAKNFDPLSDLIDNYGNVKQQADHFKAVADGVKNQIKQIMLSENSSKASGNFFTVTLSERRNESFDMDKLVKILLESDLPEESKKDLIIYKPTVDMDLFETLLYHDVISDELKKEINTAKNVSISQVLRVKENKA